MSAIKVLIVDDSAVVRKVLVEVLRAHKGIEVIGTAPDPVFAMERMKARWPDVIVLDVEMPRMDGVTFLRKLMQERPTPVVICSTLTEAGAPTTLEALAAGAVTFITKPRLGLQDFLAGAAAEIATAIRAAAGANVRRRALPGPAAARPAVAPPKHTADVILAPANGRAMSRTTERVVALGTSTGGTQALEQVLSALPAVTPGIVIVQHMPPVFTKAFAERLNSTCDVAVKEAEHGDVLRPGLAIVAAGNYHLTIDRSHGEPRVSLNQEDLVSGHRPSVDVLMRSVAREYGGRAIGVIMTGMGKDGSDGLREVRKKGGHVVAQDKASSVIFGMNREVILNGDASEVVDLTEIPRVLMQLSCAKAYVKETAAL